MCRRSKETQCARSWEAAAARVPRVAARAGAARTPGPLLPDGQRTVQPRPAVSGTSAARRTSLRHRNPPPLRFYRVVGGRVRAAHGHSEHQLGHRPLHDRTHSVIGRIPASRNDDGGLSGRLFAQGGVLDHGNRDDGGRGVGVVLEALPFALVDLTRASQTASTEVARFIVARLASASRQRLCFVSLPPVRTDRPAERRSRAPSAPPRS